VFARLLHGEAISPPVGGNGKAPARNTGVGPRVWEFRAHTSGGEAGKDVAQSQFGPGGAGTMVPSGTSGDDVKGKAIWVMGRRIGEIRPETESGKS
jgi:hypothetical protein